MLKKIVKYGNSSALVLDRALLELLNMAEGSIVKIKTDGISLIITPQTALAQETISPTTTVEDTLIAATRKALEQSLGDSEKADAYQAALKKLCDRYATIMKNKLNAPEIRQAIAAVQKRFANDETNPEYGKQIKSVHQQYVPELECMHQEIDALVKKYIPTTSHGWDTATMNLSIAEFTKVHEKYRHLLQAVTALNEDPQYTHEMVLLAEKYQISKGSTNPKEYFEAYAQLISKNIPEYAVYQEELKKVAERFSNRTEETKTPARKAGRKKQ